MVSESDRMTSYQQKERKRNQAKIIRKLAENSMTFKELVEKTGLSRAVVNQHLKALEKKHKIKKEYKNKRILNVLQPSQIDLVEWFLDQYEYLGVPNELIQKGRDFLTTKALVSSTFLYGDLLMKLFDFLESFKTKSYEIIKDFKTFTFPLVSKRQMPDFNITLNDPVMLEIFKKLMNDMTPINFSLIMMAYQLEKEYSTETGKNYLFPKRTKELVEMYEKELDRAFEWHEEVMRYLPSQAFLFGLMTAYINACAFL